MTMNDPQRSNAEKEKGNQCFKRKDYAGAVQHYSAALRLDPGNAVVASNRAMAYLKMERFLLAKLDCERALSAEPASVKAQYRLGQALLGLKQTGWAIQALERTLELDPANQDAKNALETAKDGPSVFDSELILPIYKSEDSRSKRPLTWLPVLPAEASASSFTTTKDQQPTGINQKSINSIDNPPTSGSPTTASIGVNPPERVNDAILTRHHDPVSLPLVPTHPLELLSAWRSLRLQGDKAMLVEYIWNIPPARYVEVFGEFLDGDMLGDLVECLALRADVFDAEAISSRLVAISKVNRFSTVFLFASAKDTQRLREICQKGKLDRDAKAAVKLT